MPMTTEEIKAIASRAAQSVISCNIKQSTMPRKPGRPSPEAKTVQPVAEEPEEECHCDNLKSMEDWLSEEDEGVQCHECILTPIAEYYLGALQEEKAEPQEKQLVEAWETKDLLTIGKIMDKIKGEVGEALKKRLINYDCYAQTYKPEAAEDKKQQEE